MVLIYSYPSRVKLKSLRPLCNQHPPYTRSLSLYLHQLPLLLRHQHWVSQRYGIPYSLVQQTITVFPTRSHLTERSHIPTRILTRVHPPPISALQA